MNCCEPVRLHHRHLPCLPRSRGLIIRLAGRYGELSWSGMDSRATERKVLGYENKLLHPSAEPIPLPLDFLRSITSNFSDEQELGRGGYGVVYKGILHCGSVIAVKKFHERILAGDDRSFENEASSLMDIKHKNVVQLLGFCAESRGAMMIKQPNGEGIFVHEQIRVLCFEYMCNGGLDKHLSDESSGLEWNTRYKIIKGICSGLKYLHGRNIIHLDLKPQNILMDNTMVPKIADFGLSRFLSEQKSKIVTSNCRGTTGYMAPEYIDRGVISEKADIFSLGVIIIEILKGCKDDYPDYGKGIKIDSHHFTEKVLSNWRDRFERSSKYTPLEVHTQLVKQCIDIALACVHSEKEQRPNVSKIIEILNAAEKRCYGQNGEDLSVHNQERRPANSSTVEGRERGPRPDVVTCSIGSKEGYTNFIMELRRNLPSPRDQDPVVIDDILGENPGAYPVLRRQSARASRWLWVELEAMAGQRTFTTTLAVRDDNVYCKGFRNQRGVWYELSGERTIQNCPMLPSSGEWGNVEQLPGWDVSYSSILQVDNREQIEDILSAGLGRAFAETAVRRLAQYPDVDGRDDYLTRFSLAGLIIMVCEPARFNVVLDTFLGGWGSGTGLSRRLAGYMWEWKDMSHGLLQWRMDGYWPRAHRTSRQLVRSAGHALAHIHLVLNYNTNPKNAQGCYNLQAKNSRSNNPEQDKGGTASDPSRGPWGSRQHSTNNKKSVLSKQASETPKDDNAPDDPSEPGEDDRERHSPGEMLPGDDNAPNPGHPGEDDDSSQAPGQHPEDDNAHQGPDQPGEDDISQQLPGKISERFGRPRVEIFAVRANFHATGMTISVFDGIRGQIVYMPKDQGEQQPEAMEEDEEMNDLQQPEAMEEDEQMKDLVLTGPYRGISAYGNFAIHVDMPSSATGSGKKEASPSSSGDADGPITWEWDRYNPEHATQVDAPEPVTHAIWLDSWRKTNVTYLVMSNAVEATVKFKLPETPRDYLPHEEVQVKVEADGGSKYTARGTITVHIGGFEKHPIVLFTSAVEVSIPSESLTLPLARPAVQVPQGKRLHIDMADLHIVECSSNREVKKPADSDSLSFHFGHESPTPRFNNDTEEVEVNVTWRPQQNKEKIQVKPHQVCIIRDKEEFSAFIGNLRRVLADHPDRQDAFEDYRGQELASTGKHPVLTRPRAKLPKRWIHIQLQVVAGQETWSTTLAVRDDKCYGVGFMSQRGVWYDLGNRRGDRALPPEYNSVLLDWGVSYKDVLHVSSWDEVVEELDSARLGKDFAEKAVRTLSRYPYVQEGDNTRLAVAGLFIMVCESAKFNPLRKHFVEGWDNGTGFPRKLMNYIRNWGHVSCALLRWKDLGYDYDTWRHYLGQQPVGIITDPENALDVVHLVFNNREAPSNQREEIRRGSKRGSAALGKTEGANHSEAKLRDGVGVGRPQRPWRNFRFSKETTSSAQSARPLPSFPPACLLHAPARNPTPAPPPDRLPMVTPRKPIKLTVPSQETTIGKFLTHSGTFKDGDLRVNKDGLRIVSQSEGGEAPPIEPLDSHLSLDDLDVIKVIGKSSSGNVQLVRHKFTGQFFALKVIQLNIDESIRKRIAKELKINLSTQCQYVVVFYQCFYVNGAISIVLEYMDGGSLADFLKTVKTIPEDHLAAICKQVLKGLIHLHHERRIIHRDLKPSNILINHRGEVKISDFGVSAIISSSSGQRDTFVGTCNYMAPERISGKKHGYLSNIWSLGLVILECATGTFPFPPRESFYELLEAVVEHPPPSAPSEQFSPEFCSFISSCIQKDANDRKSAQVLLDHPFLSMYDDLHVDLAAYFTTSGSPLATFNSKQL